MKDEDLKNKLLKKYEKKLNELKEHSKYQEDLNKEIKKLYPEALAYISGNNKEYEYKSYINLVGKDRICTEKDDGLTIEEKKTILSNTLELLEVDINENFNNKINIFPKVNKYTQQFTNVFDEFKDKIDDSKHKNNDSDEDYNYEYKVITLLKKLNRNHIFEYENKKFYPFIYDIFNTYRYISFEIDKYTPIIKKINQVKEYVEITDQKVKDISQIYKIFKMHQIKNLIYILFNDDYREIKEYHKLMILLFYKNEKTDDVFEDKRINNYLKKLNDVREDTITAYKQFIYY